MMSPDKYSRIIPFMNPPLHRWNMSAFWPHHIPSQLGAVVLLKLASLTT